MQYSILGDDMQAVTFHLEPEQKVFGEAGAMLYMDSHIHMETTLNAGNGQGSMLGGLMSGLKRAISGATFFVTTFKAEQGPGEVTFGAPYPGKIIPFELAKTGPMLCQRDAFLCAEAGIDISIAFTQKLGAGFFGGEGFVLQKLTGEGNAFVHSGGMIIAKTLAMGETLRVHAGCLVALSESVDYDIQLAPGIKTMIFGGDGIFFATLRGPGVVYIQTLPLSRLADRIVSAAHIPSSEGRANMSGGNLAGDIGGAVLGGIFGNRD